MARQIKTADETDAFGPHKDAFIWRAGDRKKIKAAANRRDRRAVRVELRGEYR